MVLLQIGNVGNGESGGQHLDVDVAVQKMSLEKGLGSASASISK